MINSVMKKSLFLNLMSLVVILPLQAQRDEQSLYQHKIKIYSRMQAAGWTMTGIGGGLMVAGTVILASMPPEYWNPNEDYYELENLDDELRALGGYVCLGLGVGMLTGGIIMGSIGTRKVNFYRGKLDNLSITPVITPNVQGFSLVY